MKSQGMATDLRMRRIRKVSRVFKFLFLLLFIIQVAFAGAIWFLPAKENSVRANFKSVRNGSGFDTSTEVVTGNDEPVKHLPANQPGAPAVASPSDSKTISFRIGTGNNDAKKMQEERPRSEFLWAVRSLAFVGYLYKAFGLWIVYQLFRYFEMGHIFTAETVRSLKQVGLWMLGYWAWENVTELTDLFTHNPAFTDLRLDLIFAGGFLVLLISWVMDEGRKLQEEQALTI